MKYHIASRMGMTVASLAFIFSVVADEIPADVLEINVPVNETQSGFTDAQKATIKARKCTAIWKTGPGTLSVSEAQAEASDTQLFRSGIDILIKGGIYSIGHARALGGVDDSGKGVTYVHAGAELYAPGYLGTQMLDTKEPLFIAGSGSGLADHGAVTAGSSTFVMGAITLTDDATICNPQNVTCDTRNYPLDLNGYTLTIRGNFGVDKATAILNPGDIVSESGSFSLPTCEVRNASAKTIRVKDPTKVTFGARTAFCDYSLTYDNLVDWSQYTPPFRWDGRVTFATSETAVISGSYRLTGDYTADDMYIRYNGGVTSAGNLTYSGAGTSAAKCLRLVLGGASAIGGTFRLTGGRTELLPGATLTAQGGLEFAGGHLTVQGDGTTRAVTLPAVRQTSGATELTIEDGVTVTLADLTITSGTLNLVSAWDQPVTFLAEALKGTTPTGLLWNGRAATIGADGGLGLKDVTAISATDDEVPSTTATVGILSAGTGAKNTTLATASVAVGALAQFLGSPATIDIGADETLTAGRLVIDGTADDLTLGEAAGVGTVAGADGLLVVDNASETAELKVNAALASGTSVQVDRGAATLAGGVASKADVTVKAGTLTVAGDRTVRLGTVTVGSATQTPAKLVFDDAGDVVLGAEPFSLGDPTEARDDTRPPVEMLVRDSSLVTDGAKTSWTSKDYGATIVVGRRHRAILEIQGDSLVSNKLCLGGIYNSDTEERFAQGTVRQTGGTVFPISVGGQDYASGVGIMHANGHYLLEGGKLHATRYFSIGMYCPGSLTQTGGELYYNGSFNVGACNNGLGFVTFAGGAASVNEMYLCGGGQSCTANVLLEDGADVTVRASIGVGTPSSGHSRAAIVLNGGVLQTPGLYSYNTYPDNQTCSIGFGGGTLRLRGEGNDIFQYSTKTNFDHVVVYAGGCTIDTNGKAANFTKQSFVGPTLGGVASITMPQATYTDVSCPPVIDITGDGFGAVAVPVWDPATRVWSGVRIVQRGSGYTSATATAYKTGVLTYFSVACEITDNANTGSFTKAGSGDFAFKAANSYGGDTVLKGGELKATVAGAIPSGSTVVFAGGKLILGSGVVAPTAYAVDYAVSSVATPSTGGYQFPANATIKVRNLPASDWPERVDLLDLGVGYTGPKPEVDLSGVTVPKGWKIRWVGNKLRLSHLHGLLIYVR